MRDVRIDLIRVDKAYQWMLLQAEALPYKRCCLESYSSQIFNFPAGKKVKQQVFYPFTLLWDTGSLTIETGKRS